MNCSNNRNVARSPRNKWEARVVFAEKKLVAFLILLDESWESEVEEDEVKFPVELIRLINEFAGMERNRMSRFSTKVMINQELETKFRQFGLALAYLQCRRELLAFKHTDRGRASKLKNCFMEKEHLIVFNFKGWKGKAMVKYAMRVDMSTKRFRMLNHWCSRFRILKMWNETDKHFINSILTKGCTRHLEAVPLI